MTQAASTVYYNEIEKFACAVIRRNIERGRLPEGFIDERDISTVTADELVGYRQFHLFAGIGIGAYACRLAGLSVNTSIATVGFPCQDISCAGKGAGMDGEKSGLYWQALRLLSLVRPRWILLENVPGLRTQTGGDPDDITAVELVIHGLEIIGYSVLPPVVVGADDAGAPQRRKRVWIVARSNESLADPDLLQWWEQQQLSLRSGARSWHQSGGRRDGMDDADSHHLRSQHEVRPGRHTVGGSGEGTVGHAAGVYQRGSNLHCNAIPAGGATREISLGAGPGELGDAAGARSGPMAARPGRERVSDSDRAGNELGYAPGHNERRDGISERECQLSSGGPGGGAILANPNGPERRAVSEAGDVADGHDAGRKETPGRSTALRQDDGITGLANPDGDGRGGLLRQAGCGPHESKLGPHPDGQGDRPGQAVMADASGAGLEVGEGRRIDDEQECTALARSGGFWPARPGQPQYDWEAPRVVESAVGRPVAGPSERLVRCIRGLRGWTDARIQSWWQKNAVKLAARHRREALKAYGNCWVPQTAVPILQWIKWVDEQEKSLL